MSIFYLHFRVAIFAYSSSNIYFLCWCITLVIQSIGSSTQLQLPLLPANGCRSRGNGPRSARCPQDKLALGLGPHSPSRSRCCLHVHFEQNYIMKFNFYVLFHFKHAIYLFFFAEYPHQPQQNIVVLFNITFEKCNNNLILQIINNRVLPIYDFLIHKYISYDNDPHFNFGVIK